MKRGAIHFCHGIVKSGTSTAGQAGEKIAAGHALEGTRHGKSVLLYPKKTF
jgi:hypothetical protein